MKRWMICADLGITTVPVIVAASQDEAEKIESTLRTEYIKHQESRRFGVLKKRTR